MRRAPDERVMGRYRACAGEMAIPSVVWHELIYGTRRLPESRRRAYADAFVHEAALAHEAKWLYTSDTDFGGCEGDIEIVLV